MPRTLRHVITYPKPIGRAWQDLTDPGFQEAKLIAAGARSPVVTISTQDDGTTLIVLERDNPVVGVPSAVRRIVGETAHVIERVTWSAPGPDGHRTAELLIDFAGIPISVHGAMELDPAGGTTTLTVTAEYRASVPLVGGKLEETAASQTIRTLDAEAEFSAGWAG